MHSQDDKGDSNHWSEIAILRKNVIPYLRKLGFQYFDSDVTGIVGPESLRADFVIFLDEDKSNPLIIVELKRSLPVEVTLLHPSVQHAFTVASAISDQIKYLLITDGQKYFWFERNAETLSLIQLKHAPNEFVGNQPPSVSPSPEELSLEPSEYISLLQSLANILGKGYLSYSLKVGIEINRLLITKIIDEENTYLGRKPRFQTGGNSKEFVVSQIQELYIEAINRLGIKNEEQVVWSVPPDTLYKAVELLEPYSISSVPKSIRDRSFWEIFQVPLRSEIGQYTTPEYLAELMVYLVRPSLEDSVIDPACGSGLLLLEAIRSARIKFLFKEKESDTLLNNNQNINVHGLEVNPSIAELAKTNFVISRENPNLIQNVNSLDIDEITKKGISLGSYDIVIMDPPVGGKINDDWLLKNFKLSRRASRTEILFLELAIRLLSPKGKLVTLLPDSFLSTPAFEYARRWLLEQGNIKAIISLPSDAFSMIGHLGKASILLFEKADNSIEADSNTLIADILSIGYDRFGNRTRNNDIPKLLDFISQFFETGTTENMLNKDGLRIWVIESKELHSTRLDVPSLDPGGNSVKQTLLHGQFPVVKLKEVSEIISGISPKQFIEKNSKSATVIQAGSVREMELLIEESLNISEEEYSSSKRAQLRDGDVLVTSTGQYIGRAAVVENLKTKAVATSAVTILRPIKEINPFFLASFINSEMGKEQINLQKAAATAQPFIRRSDLGEIFIPLPPLNKQIEIAQRVNDLLIKSRKLAEESSLLSKKARSLIVDEVSGENEDE